MIVSPKIFSLAAAALVLLGSPAVAESSFPEKPITIVVPFAAGGPTDLMTRLLASSMTQDFQQPVLVDNVSGAGGTIASRRVAESKPDGHLLLLHHIGMSTAPALYRTLPYDPVGGFQTIGLVADVPMTLVARRDFPASNMLGASAYIRREGDSLTYANAGVGAASHLCGLLLQKALGTQLTTVAFRGTGPAMQDLMAGRVDLMCDQTTNTAEQIRTNQLKVFAVTMRDRSAALPDVPTSAEGGLPTFEVSVWHGLYAAKGTPPEITDRLSRALQFSLRDPRVLARFSQLGAVAATQERATPDAHRAFWLADIAKWRPIIEASGQYAD
jgi:tripartite-type tricarboxylate transporter receptor subunit TctC